MTRELLVAGRRWRKIARATAARHGMSEAASAPLVWVGRLGGNVRQNVLANAVGIEGASLVRLLDELEASGLVVREADPGDRRAKSVSLTPTGRTRFEEVTSEMQELRLQVFAGLSRRDIEGAMRVFAAIRAGTPAETNSKEPLGK